MLDYYRQDRKTACTAILTEKYGLAIRTCRVYIDLGLDYRSGYADTLQAETYDILKVDTSQAGAVDSAFRQQALLRCVLLQYYTGINVFLIK